MTQPRRNGFDTESYVQIQTKRIREKIEAYEGPTYIEFGGKPFGDHHAARVLPGYDYNCKARILHELGLIAKIVMVVNARDILPEPTGRYPRGRIRGDSNLKYHEETIRMIANARDLGISIEDVVLSITPYLLNAIDEGKIQSFQESLDDCRIKFYRHFEIKNYPHPSILGQIEEMFTRNDVITEPGKHIIVFSPGGGSGKFGVILSEIYHALRRGVIPNFLKFETFPAFALPERHPLNLAFEAATADLRNSVIQLSEGITTYDKDIENFQLLKGLYYYCGVDISHPIIRMLNPTDMSVNLIQQGIYEMREVVEACGIEILRRYQRYVAEHAAGTGKLATVLRAKGILEEYINQYPSMI